MWPFLYDFATSLECDLVCDGNNTFPLGKVNTYRGLEMNISLLSTFSFEEFSPDVFLQMS